MPYTLWSRGILIGATDFALGDAHSCHLSGVFQPAESGMMILPAITAMAPALLDLRALMRREQFTEEDIERDFDRARQLFEYSPEGKRVIASAKEIEQLELRSPSGEVLATEMVLVSDLLEMNRFAMRTTRRRRRRSKRRADPIRYLISVTLMQESDAMLT